MSQIQATALKDLSSALRDCYLKMPQLDEFLRTKLDRRVDDLTSRYLPLTDSISEVVQKAQTQGWVTDLVTAAAEDRPQNEALAKLLAALPTLAIQTTLSIARNQNDRPSLVCGRGEQWNEVCQCAPGRLHRVLLVAGGRGQDSLHFRDRVQTFLTDPTLNKRTVSWKTPPATLDEMAGALAVALETTVDGLPQVMADKLAFQNLVLLHPCLLQGFAQTCIAQYYTEYLPGLLAKQQGQGGLKCVQPIEWPVSQPAGFLRRIWAGDDGATQGRADAARLMTALRATHAENVRIFDVDELQNLQRKELDAFLESSDFPVEHQKLLLDQLLSGPQIPAFMFKTIDDYWKGLGATS